MIDQVRSADDYAAIDAILHSWNMQGSERIKGKLIVYRDGEEIVGCASCYHPDATRFDRWLNAVAVKRGRQRQGIGKALVKHFIDELLPRHELWLETMFWNRRFYEAIGFNWIPAKEIPNHFGFDPRQSKRTLLMAQMR